MATEASAQGLPHSAPTFTPLHLIDGTSHFSGKGVTVIKERNALHLTQTQICGPPLNACTEQRRSIKLRDIPAETHTPIAETQDQAFLHGYIFLQFEKLKYTCPKIKLRK